MNVFAVVRRRRRRRRLRRLRRPQLQWRRFVYGALRDVNVDVASSCQRAWCVAVVVVVVVLLHGGPLFFWRVCIALKNLYGCRRLRLRLDLKLDFD